MKSLIKYISICLFSILMISCTESSKYNSKIKLNNNVNFEYLVKTLNEKGFDYKIENNILRYHYADTNEIIKIALYAQDTPQDSSERERTWEVSSEKAKDIILKEYPDILTNAVLFGPSISKVNNELKGFSVAHEKVWHIRIHCKAGSTYALFFVHPTTGKIFVIKKPENKNNCTK